MAVIEAHESEGCIVQICGEVVYERRKSGYDKAAKFQALANLRVSNLRIADYLMHLPWRPYADICA
jgi:hypothetical protein